MGEKVNGNLSFKSQLCHCLPSVKELLSACLLICEIGIVVYSLELGRLNELKDTNSLME